MELLNSNKIDVEDVYPRILSATTEYDVQYGIGMPKDYLSDSDRVNELQFGDGGVIFDNQNRKANTGGKYMDGHSLIEEKFGRAEERWQHSMELHAQRVESLFRESEERARHSEELNRALIKNIGENTDRVVRAISERTDKMEAKEDKLETKIDEAVKEIKTSNRNTVWASVALVVTVLATLVSILSH
jgi:hypothetical protein